VTDRTYNVLFLCTGNSARSVLAEALLNHAGKGRFHACSAGSFPIGRVNPFATDLLTRIGLPTQGLRSKSWDEFSTPDAPQMDFIFTVCDNAANEVCPVWPGHPMTAHWGVADPAAVDGSDADRVNAFRETLRILERRIEAFISLPIASLDKLALGTKLKDIGRSS
jgi:arsenate reductase